MKKNVGITLISLVVTIIILLILAGVSINLISGGNGILGKTQTAVDETEKQTATEKINFKITSKQIDSYAENSRMPTLKELAEFLNVDEEIQYVYKESKAEASLDWWGENDNYSSIFTKLEEYPYEFEIGNDLRLASINGVKIADNSNNVSSEELKNMKATINALQEKIVALETSKSEMSNQISELENKLDTTNAETQTAIDNIQKSALTVDTLYTGTASSAGTYSMSKSVKNYKYLIVYMGGNSASNINNIKSSQIIKVSDIVYNNSSICDNVNNASYWNQSTCISEGIGYSYWFKNDKEFYFNPSIFAGSYKSAFIYQIDGIK